MDDTQKIDREIDKICFELEGIINPEIRAALAMKACREKKIFKGAILSYAQIGRILGVSVEKVKGIEHSAMRKIERALSKRRMNVC